MRSSKFEIAEHVSSCIQLAILLEVSSKKPGNVNPNEDFNNTKFEHFLASAVAVKPSLRKAAEHGVKTVTGSLTLNEIGVGSIIREATEEIRGWQRGGNTLLGSTILLAPIASAAGMTLAESHTSQGSSFLGKLRLNIERVVKHTTPVDAVNVYEAISIAKPAGLSGKTSQLDVNDPDSKREILDRKVTLFDVFSFSASYDSISNEWVKNYPVTFDIGLPYFRRMIGETGNLRQTVVHTFLEILSKVPDTLIERKTGLAEAKEISKEAKKVLDLGGASTPGGMKRLSELDVKLRDHEHKFNPGTTADLLSAVLAASVLDGFRP